MKYQTTKTNVIEERMTKDHRDIKIIIKQLSLLHVILMASKVLYMKGAQYSTSGCPGGNRNCPVVTPADIEATQLKQPTTAKLPVAALLRMLRMWE